jgi:hypothetical protein
VTSEAEQCRRLARELHFMARDLLPGKERSALLKMAEEWDRLADQQERATDYGVEKTMADDFEVLGLLSGVAIGIVIILLLL